MRTSIFVLRNFSHSHIYLLIYNCYYFLAINFAETSGQRCPDEDMLREVRRIELSKESALQKDYYLFIIISDCEDSSISSFLYKINTVQVY